MEPIVIGSILALIGLSLVSVAVAKGLAIRREVSDWVPLIGRYECRLREENDSLSRFRYSYTDRTGRTRYSNAWTFFAGDLRLGDELPLLAHPHRDEVRVRRFGFLYARPLELGGTGIAILCMALLLLLAEGR